MLPAKKPPAPIFEDLHHVQTAQEGTSPLFNAPAITRKIARRISVKGGLVRRCSPLNRPNNICVGSIESE